MSLQINNAGAEGVDMTYVERWSADKVRKSDVTRQSILEALEGLLADRPLSDLSIGDIAAAAGVRRTAFYFYFPSKAVAVTTLLDEVYEDTLTGAADVLSEARHRASAIRDALAHMWTLWLRHRSLMVAVGEARASDREAAAIWERWFDRFAAAGAESIAADRAAGLALPGPEPAIIARLLLGMNARCLEDMLRENATAKQADLQLDALAAIWVRSVYGPPEDPPGRG